MLCCEAAFGHCNNFHAHPGLSGQEMALMPERYVTALAAILGQGRHPDVETPPPRA